MADTFWWHKQHKDVYRLSGRARCFFSVCPRKVTRYWPSLANAICHGRHGLGPTMMATRCFQPMWGVLAHVDVSDDRSTCSTISTDTAKVITSDEYRRTGIRANLCEQTGTHKSILTGGICMNLHQETYCMNQTGSVVLGDGKEEVIRLPISRCQTGFHFAVDLKWLMVLK
jgi:hypothetical protein